MRIVVLCSSPYSETGCAMAAHLARRGHVPVGALTLPAAEKRTLLRKLGQLGWRASARYAWSKLVPKGAAGKGQIHNPYLEEGLRFDGRLLLNLQEVARAYGFPVFSCPDQNSPRAIAQLREWSPDLVIFTGGDILREEFLKVPRLGVLNSHLALLPEIRGMSSPEWSLLTDVPLGVTIHYMDRGIDTGPILLRREFSSANECASLSDLRHRMIAFGIELVEEVVVGLKEGTISAKPQSDRDKDNQFFVMHEQLKLAAARRLRSLQLSPVGKVDG
jgi:folate-dependent phosphoribosylglycinamide formyltransferase PurN